MWIDYVWRGCIATVCVRQSKDSFRESVISHVYMGSGWWNSVCQS